ncbi:MAG: hypothetical protein RLZZ242_364 [Bacteroidota bacterium]
MKFIRPFKGWVVSSDSCSHVVIKHIDSYTPETLEEELHQNPHSFLHVLAPSLFTNTELDLKERFSLVRERLIDHLYSDRYKRISQECLWMYRIHSSRVKATGIVGITPIASYQNGVIKKHEHTKAFRRDALAAYLDEVGIHADPVVLALADTKTAFKSWCSQFGMNQQPLISLALDDEVHELWPITDQKSIDEIQQIIEQNNTAYIVDGHHRIESSLHWARTNKDTHQTLSNSCFMSCFLSEDELSIRSFSKSFTTMITSAQCKEILQSYGTLRPLTDQVHPNQAHLITINQETFSFHLNETSRIEEVQRALEDLPSKDSSKHEMTRLTLTPKPYTVEDLKRAAETQRPMAAKSTYIEPKLLTGLLIYPIS